MIADHGKQPISLNPLRLKIVTEAVTPHNNYLFDALARDPAICLELHYIFTAKNVPGRPWRHLQEDVGAELVRTGIGRWFDAPLIRAALAPKSGVFFIIGWNHLCLSLLICLLGLRRAPLLTWFDTPAAKERFRFWDLRPLAKRFLIRMIQRCPGVVFVTGRRAREACRALGFGEEKMQMLPFFVPQAEGPKVSYGEARRSLQMPLESVVFLVAGRLIPSKGVDVFIEALHRLHVSNQGRWFAVVVGSGSEGERLAARASELGLGQRLRFVPWLEPDEYECYLQACDVFVAPARFDPFPTTIMSAMHLGKAVVATEGTGSATEFIESGVNGIRVPIDDVEALARSLTSLLENPAQLVKLGKAAATTLAQWPVNRGVEIIKRELRALT